MANYINEEFQQPVSWTENEFQQQDSKVRQGKLNRKAIKDWQDYANKGVVMNSEIVTGLMHRDEHVKPVIVREEVNNKITPSLEETSNRQPNREEIISPPHDAANQNASPNQLIVFNQNEAINHMVAINPPGPLSQFHSPHEEHDLMTHIMGKSSKKGSRYATGMMASILIPAIGLTFAGAPLEGTCLAFFVLSAASGLVGSAIGCANALHEHSNCHTNINNANANSERKVSFPTFFNSIRRDVNNNSVEPNSLLIPSLN